MKNSSLLLHTQLNNWLQHVAKQMSYQLFAVTELDSHDIRDHNA